MRFAPRRTKQRAPQSPLYTLPAAVAAKLAAKCAGTETLNQIRNWLSKNHGISTSLTALSRWWAKHYAVRQGAAESRAAEHGVSGAVEIIITPHPNGATRLLIRPVSA